MPKKIRELIAMLSKAGFRSRPGKGSHTIWRHRRYPGIVTIAGNDNSDSQAYMQRQVERAIAKVQEQP